LLTRITGSFHKENSRGWISIFYPLKNMSFQLLVSAPFGKSYLPRKLKALNYEKYESNKNNQFKFISEK